MSAASLFPVSKPNAGGDGFASFAGAPSTVVSAASSGKIAFGGGSSRFGQSENKRSSPFRSQSPPGGAFSNFTSNGPSVFGKLAQTGTSVFGRTKSESHSVFEQPSAGGAFGALEAVSSSVSGQPAQAAFRESGRQGSPTIPSSPDSDIVEPSASLSKRLQLVTCKRPHCIRSRLLGLTLLVIPCPTFLRDDTDDEKPGGFGLKASTSSSSPTATITSSARTTLFSAFSGTSLPFAAVGGTTQSFGDLLREGLPKPLMAIGQFRHSPEMKKSAKGLRKQIRNPFRRRDGEQKVPDSDDELGGHIEEHDHHGDDDDEGDFLSESYDSHLGEGEEQSEEVESEEVEGKKSSDEPSPSSSPEPTGIPLPPSRSLSNTPQAETPKIEPNSPSPSTSEDSFLGGMTQKLHSGSPQPLFSPFPAAFQPGMSPILLPGTPKPFFSLPSPVPLRKIYSRREFGYHFGWVDLEEQPKRVAVVGPVEFAGVFNNRLSKLLLVTRVRP
ncbi:MAG: hypothetical protein NXY57DRAFT_967589 [Lentinula lateritia]|nr:MAG: hypothetical protein NXY57DRAFT_967589 [Lentinula lateritia]